MPPKDKSKPINNEAEGHLAPNPQKRRSLKKQKSVSFGMVRIHKITHGVDPPSSSQAPSAFAENDLTETGLVSLETFERVHRSPVKRPNRTRCSTNKPTGFSKCAPLCGNQANYHQDVQMSFNLKLAALCYNKASYRVITAVGNEYPGKVLMAHEVSPRRMSVRRDSLDRLPKERIVSRSAKEQLKL